MSVSKLFSVALMATFLSACTANLKVVKAEGSVTPTGVPFRMPVVYVFSGVLTQHSQGAICNERTPFYETRVLPGELYYANVETEDLAKSEFVIELTDQGTLKKISLNSDTTVDDIASGVANLLDKALPLLAPPSPPAPEAKFHKLPACDAGKEVKHVETFENFRKG